ncbi:hypothetical protein LTR12_018614, partial [Friedmanniomyces endolithicus]
RRLRPHRRRRQDRHQGRRRPSPRWMAREASWWPAGDSAYGGQGRDRRAEHV